MAHPGGVESVVAAVLVALAVLVAWVAFDAVRARDALELGGGRTTSSATTRRSWA